MAERFKLPTRFESSEKNMWSEYSELILKYKPAVNLGMGYPDFHAPEHVLKALSRVALNKDPFAHQYTRSFGHARLVQNISKLYSPLIGRDINPQTEILVGVGAFGALYVAILGHVDVGDEVIVIEPFFDCYSSMVKSAGGMPRFIPLRPKETTGSITSADWVLDEKELAGLFNDRTKMIILNNPHNPVGKVFNMEELQLIADLCKKHNVLCLSDEVNEWVVFDSKQHIRIATLPGMWERTITVGSASKTFAVTGWRIGWAYGDSAILHNLQVVHQKCLYTCCTPIQEAVADALEFELSRRDTPEYFMTSFAQELQPKRDMLYKTLADSGFKATMPDAGYFIFADWTELANKIDLSSEDDQYKDYRFTKKFAKEVGVLTLPPSTFYSKEHKHLGESFARFCYIKKDENLALAEKLIKEWIAKK